MSSGRGLSLRRVGLIGLGPLGGSLARALRALSSPPEILASSEDAAELERAVAAGFVQRPSTPDRIASTADLVVYLTPPEVTAGYLGAHAERWRAGAVITDVSPVKRHLADTAHALGVAGRFVPSHPVLAATHAPAPAGRADLFAGARVWVMPLQAAAEPAAREVEAFWRALGAQPLRADPERHDRLLAWTEQLPQAVATALAVALSASGYPPQALSPDAAAMRALPGEAGEWERALLENAALLEDPLLALEGALGLLAEAVRSRDADALRAIRERAAGWRQD